MQTVRIIRDADNSCEVDMDFDLDDPLGDLLSDGSNDSFFGTSKKKTDTTKPSTQSAGDTKAKSKVADLFGFESESTTKPVEPISAKLNPDLITTPKKPTQSTEPRKKEESVINSPGNRQQSIKSSTPERSVQQTASSLATQTPKKAANVQSKPMKRETQFDDSDDFLNELGFDPKNPRGSIVNAKKSNILDDILNFNRNEPPAPKSTPMAPAPKPVQAPGDTDRRGITRPPTDSNPSTNRYSPSSRRPRNLPRSGSGSSDADPLGFFTSPAKQTQDTKTDDAPRSKPSKKPTVDWLGLDAESEVKPDEIVPAVTVEAIKPKTDTIQPQNLVVSTASTIPPANVISTVQALPLNPPTLATTATVDSIAANLNMINMASLDKEHALQSLQQQETQLRIAAQMKQQESMLQDMHIKQQNLIKQQENQFNDLLRRQIDRQNQLETQIQRQQEQINSYINVLMNQPSIGLITAAKVTAANDTDMESGHSDEEITRPNRIELEADVKRLELEKLRLEDILQSVQTSHEQELELLQLSHK